MRGFPKERLGLYASIALLSQLPCCAAMPSLVRQPHWIVPLAVLCGVASALAITMAFRRRAELARRRARFSRPLVATSLASIVVIAIQVIVALVMIASFQTEFRSGPWRKVEAQVSDTWVTRESWRNRNGEHGTIFRPHVKFAWTLDGSGYSRELEVICCCCSTDEGANERLDDWPFGRSYPLWASAASPGVAVLNPVPPLDVMALSVGLLVGLAGGALLLGQAALVAWLRRRGELRWRSEPRRDGPYR
jgi:hypothetical protein